MPLGVCHCWDVLVADSRLASTCLCTSLHVTAVSTSWCLSCVLQVTPELREVTLEALAAKTPAGQQAAALLKSLSAAAAANRSRQHNKGGSSRSSGQKQQGVDAQASWEQLVQLQALAAEQVLSGAQVVAATCVGAGEVPCQQHVVCICLKLLRRCVPCYVPQTSPVRPFCPRCNSSQVYALLCR
jgi:hypothetical protein